MKFDEALQDLKVKPLDDRVRTVAIDLLVWIESLSVDNAQFITARRAIDRVGMTDNHELVLPALYILTQTQHPVLKRGVYWTDENGSVRQLDPDLYAEALQTGILAHPDYGTEHSDFMDWVEPFFWLERAKREPENDVSRA